MARIFKTLVLLGLFVPNIAYADRYETTNLFRHKAWSVSITHDQLEDTFWCDAKTSNRRNQLFSITAFESGGLGLFVFDNRWSLRKRALQFRIDVDYSRWIVNGNAEDTGVSTFLSNPESSVKFLTEVAEGSAIAVYNSDNRKIATFSLSGSSASLRKLMECWKRISPTDPFETGQGQAIPQSDPF